MIRLNQTYTLTRSLNEEERLNPSLLARRGSLETVVTPVKPPLCELYSVA
jgi:hypothetical protein